MLNLCDLQSIGEKRHAVFYDFLLFYIPMMVRWKVLPNFARNFHELFNLLCSLSWYLRMRSFLSYNKYIFIKTIKILAFALKMLSVIWSHSWLLRNHCFTLASSHRIFYRQELKKVLKRKNLQACFSYAEGVKRHASKNLLSSLKHG